MRGLVGLILGILLGMGGTVGGAQAAEVVQGASPQLQKCLKKADAYPDIGAADAQAWMKRDPANIEARLCRAIAQANRGMHADSAREFWALASTFNKPDPARAALMHVMAGQEFLRAKDTKDAEARFAEALKLSPNEVQALTGRAQCRIAVEKYWDALADLNRALKIEPDNVDALRQRGRTWLALGQDANAREDFAHAHLADGGKMDLKP